MFLPSVNTGYAVVKSPEIKTRADFAELCNQHGLLGRAVEIGVDKAAFAVRFLRGWKGNRIDLVDPWAPLEDCAEISRDREADFALAVAALAPFNWRVEIQRCTSEEAARRCRAPLDFVHIDANHDYKHVEQDIDLWWPHVRRGGILAGHDVGDQYPGVLQAVREFACREGLTVFLTSDSPASWYCYKPVMGTLPALRHSCEALHERVSLSDAAMLGECLLTLIIPRLAERKASWKHLQMTLAKQQQGLGLPESTVEILTDVSDEPVARKRQRMFDAARGRYVAFVDDDDMVSEEYLRSLVMTIIHFPAVDVVSFEGKRTEDGAKCQRMHWSLATPQNQRTEKTRYIMANHLCAMRRDLCQEVRFWRETAYGSDQIYWRSLHVAKLLQTEVHLPDQLYHYNFRWDVTKTQGKDRYAETKALNPHQLYRILNGPRQGEFAYHLGNVKDGIRVMVRDGTRHTMQPDQIESLGAFDVW